MREQQRDTGQGRARFGRARAEVRRGGSGQTRTKGNEVAHGSTLARTVAERRLWRGKSEGEVTKRRSGRVWTNTSADTSESVLPVTGSTRFSKRVRVQDNRPSSTHDNRSRRTSSSPMESRHRRAYPIANPIHRGNLLSAYSSL
jgi:hypothetical protein